MKKFVLSSESCVVNGVTLYRVQAVRDFLTSGEVPVAAGELGGWVESESCLSQEGACWVADEACVFAGSVVSGDACVFESAVVTGDSCVFGSARVSGHVFVERSLVRDSASISGSVSLSDCQVGGRCWLNCHGRLADLVLGGELSLTGAGSVDASEVG